jgi:hypothetical protein
MTFHLPDLSRDVPRKDWYSIWRVFRRCETMPRKDQSVLAARVPLVKQIRDCEEHGLIGFNVDQMDCDCSRWTSSRDIPAHPLAFEKAVEGVGNDAEGPIYGIWISKPSKKAKYESRDLALEAFEDGHPHSVSTCRYDEEGCYD